MAEKMIRSFRNVLAYLGNRPDNSWTPGMMLPNGHGHRTNRLHASGATLKSMLDEGLIEYGKAPSHSLFGYRITPAGRRALDETSHGR